MPVKAQISAGVAAASIGRRHNSVRRKGEPCGEYERARVQEIRNRAALYELKLKRLEEELLDWAVIRVEMEQIFDAIRQIIGATSMTQREKADCLCNLRPVGEIIAQVASMQNAELERRGGNGNGNGLGDSDDDS